MKRILCLILCAVMLCGMMGVSASAEGTLKMNFESVTAKAGQTVQIAVTLENNPGITGFCGTLTYDKNALSYKPSTGFTAKTDKGTWDNTGTRLMWYYDGVLMDEDEEEILDLYDSYTGTDFFVLTFTVKEDAAPGAYAVTVEIDPEYDGFVDKDNVTITDYAIVAGTVTVEAEPVVGGTLKMNFESVTAEAGQTVQIAVTLENNPGITGFCGTLTYDKNALSYKPSTGFTAKTDKGTWDNTGTRLMWYYDGVLMDEDEEEILDLYDSYTGTDFFVLTFTVKEDAAPGAYAVTVEIDPEYDGFVDKDNVTITDYEIVAGTVTVEGAETLADGYYLIGQKGWDVASIDPEQKFETNPENADEFLLETGLAVGDGIKVVKVENGAIAEWYPGGVDNQYVVDAAHAGRKTIYFHPWYADAWNAFGGYIWIDGALTVGAEVYGSSVSLKGDIALNFFLILPEELTDDTGAYVTLNDAKYPISEAKTRDVDGVGTLYQFTIALTAKQMNDKVTLKVFTGEDAAVALYRHSNGEDVTETGYVYSVQDYIQKTLENPESPEKLKALVQAMSDYGSLAQVQFEYNLENLAEVKGDLDSVTLDSVAKYAPKVTEGAATGVTFVGPSLVLKTETALRLYFELAEGEIGDYTFKVGTKMKTPTETADGWMIEIPNISAKDLDKVYTVKVTSGDGTVLTLKVSALSYVYNTLNSETSDAKLVNLVKGVYLYNQAANAYFAG